LNALWDHPQRHAGLPADISNRTEVMLPAYFTEYQPGVAKLHSAAYQPYADNIAFSDNFANAFYKTRIGNDSEVPDLDTPNAALEEQLLDCLRSKDEALTTSAIKALSVSPRGTGPRLTIAALQLLSTHHKSDIRFVFEEELKPMRPSSAKPKPGEPSDETFKQRVQPILTRVNGDGRACVLCHSTQGAIPAAHARKGRVHRSAVAIQLPVGASRDQSRRTQAQSTADQAHSSQRQRGRPGVAHEYARGRYALGEEYGGGELRRRIRNNHQLDSQR